MEITCLVPCKNSKYISPAVRVIAMVILIGFVTISFAASLYIILHAGHNCTENLCTPCPCIAGKRLIEQVGRIIAVIGILAVIVCVMRKFGEWLYLSRKYPINLIESNIRMNN
jgi:hypothetical protein